MGRIIRRWLHGCRKGYAEVRMDELGYHKDWKRVIRRDPQTARFLSQTSYVPAFQGPALC